MTDVLNPPGSAEAKPSVPLKPFGKVLAVQPDHLLLQELTVTSAGEWHIREVRLPLHEAAP